MVGLTLEKKVLLIIVGFIITKKYVLNLSKANVGIYYNISYITNNTFPI